MRRLAPALALLLLLPAARARAGDEVTLKVLNVSAETITIYVNDVRVGDQGALIPERTHTFTADPTGKHKIHVVYGWLTTSGQSDPATFEVRAGGRVTATVGPQIGVGLVMPLKLVNGKVSVAIDDKGAEPSNAAVPPPAPPAPASRVLSVKLDRRLKRVVSKESPPIRPAQGTDKEVEDSVKISQTVSLSDGWNAEAELRGKVSAVWAEVEAGIKAGVQKTSTRSFAVETERRRKVTIRAGGSPRGVIVVWVEYYRTGTAKVEIDGKTVEVPFEFMEDFDLLTEDAE